MQIPALLFLVSIGLATSVAAQSRLENARHAQALLGPQIWSQVITVVNEARGSAYPKTVHALVFELMGILWLYTDIDGTQSFSLHRDRLAEEKADFGPLLKDIEPGFSRWSVASTTATRPRAQAEPLPNGCFIESVAALRRRLARGEAADNPRLLTFYVNSGLRKKGHTVLVYNVGEVVEVIDSSRPAQPLGFASQTGREALRLARALEGSAVVKARFHSLRELATAFEGIAASAAPQSSVQVSG